MTLTLGQVNAAFQSLTAQLMGLDPDSGVRISWPTQGAPAWGVTDDVAFIQCLLVNDPYANLLDIEYGAVDDHNNVQVTSSGTRVWSIRWVVYGPNSLDKVYLLRDRLRHDDMRELLAASGLYIVPEVQQPIRAPESFGGQWWERCDLEVRFNEEIVRGTTVGSLASASIIIVTEDNQQEVVS